MAGRKRGSPAVSRPQVSAGSRWLLSGLVVAAIGIALWGLHPLFDGARWWLQALAVAAVVVLAASVVRSFARRRAWGSVAAIVGGIAVLTVMFAAPTALLGVVPTSARIHGLS